MAHSIDSTRTEQTPVDRTATIDAVLALLPQVQEIYIGAFEQAVYAGQKPDAKNLPSDPMELQRRIKAGQAIAREAIAALEPAGVSEAEAVTLREQFAGNECDALANKIGVLTMKRMQARDSAIAVV